MLNNKTYLDRLFKSDKPLIIYKAQKGFNVYTDFSDKIFVNKKNINYFIKKAITSKKIRNSFFDGYIGFFGYELLCELIGVKIPKQNSNNFYKSIFYKPQTVIKIRQNILIKKLSLLVTENLFVNAICRSYVEQNCIANQRLPCICSR